MGKFRPKNIVLFKYTTKKYKLGWGQIETIGPDGSYLAFDSATNFEEAIHLFETDILGMLNMPTLIIESFVEFLQALLSEQKDTIDVKYHDVLVSLTSLSGIGCGYYPMGYDVYNPNVINVKQFMDKIKLSADLGLDNLLSDLRSTSISEYQ